eukprot:3226451-Amphidinium_carterae.1
MAQAPDEPESEPVSRSLARGSTASLTAREEACSSVVLWGLSTSYLHIYHNDCTAYVVWRCPGHPWGEHYYSGVHLGPNVWSRLLAAEVFPGGAYRSGRDRCRKVRRDAPSTDWVAAGVALYEAESVKHRAPR